MVTVRGSDLYNRIICQNNLCAYLEELKDFLVLEMSLLELSHSQDSDPEGAGLKIKIYVHPCS